MDIQHIELSGQPFVLMPRKDFDALAAFQEELDDVAAFDAIMAARAEDEEGFSIDFVNQLLAASDKGKPLLPIWRKYRGLTQTQLADAAGVTQVYISDIESGKKEGSVRVLKAIAECLDCDLDDLV